MADVVRARRRGLEMALDMGFVRPEATKIAVVISELARNITHYAERGVITLTAHTGEGAYFEIVSQDNGPGIEDVDRVLAGGYSTSKGLGVGVSGSKRLMDTFQVASTVGVGTTIKCKKLLR
jgi:serine/threonine-protein kinase RsbT